MMDRREFLEVLASAVIASAVPRLLQAKPSSAFASLYDVPPLGNVHFLHFTDSHAQLLPLHFREPSVNIGVGAATDRPPHVVGERFLREFGLRPGTPAAHAFTSLNFVEAAQQYGKVGGFAHLMSLAGQLRVTRPGALLLDGGDTWQGSGTALWTRGEDMVRACRLLGVDVMTAHWEFTLGAQRVQELVRSQLGERTAFVAHNIVTNGFGDPVFEPFALREMNGVPLAIIGQAFPYTPIAHPAYLIPDWTFGIQEENLQATIDRARQKGACVVILLSHNGMDVDLKLASRVRGLDAILGGHTHDAVPRPILVKNGGGVTLVTNAGSNGKFLAVLDFDVRNGRVREWQYRLLPVFANALPADGAMQALIEDVRAPFRERLAEPLAVTEDLLYRRGNFNGSFDQLILQALLDTQDAQIAFSPGFRWGSSLLPGETIRMEDVLDQTAITYPQTTRTQMSGATIKAILEDVADNLFNPDPYYQQGGDMVRVGGMSYAIEPGAPAGRRISEMKLDGKPIEAGKKYTVAGWAPVAAGAQGEPVWNVVAAWLRQKKVAPRLAIQQPQLIGVTGGAARAES